MTDHIDFDCIGAWGFEHLREALEATPEESVDEQMAKLDAVAQKKFPEIATPPEPTQDLSLVKRDIDVVEKPPQMPQPPSGYITFLEETAIGLVTHPPKTPEEKENRGLLAYLVALGLSELHRNGLCHMNLKAEHVQLGTYESSLVVYGRLADAGSVVFQGCSLRRATKPYLDMDCNPDCANPAHDMFALGLFLFELMHGRAANPLLHLKEDTKEAWRAAVDTIRATLSSDDPADQCTAKLLQPPQERPTAQQAVEAIRGFIGEDRCQQLTSPRCLLQVLDAMLPSQASSLWHKRPSLSPELSQTLCSMIYQVAVSLMRLREKGGVYKNVQPGFITPSFDKRGGSLVAALRCSSTKDPRGQMAQRDTKNHLDFGTYKGMKNRVLSPQDDCFALGITMLEAFYGVESNPLGSLPYDKEKDEVSEEAWQRVLTMIQGRDRIDGRIDQIIDGLVQPAEKRWTAEDVARVLSEILTVETAQFLLIKPPHTPDEEKERLAIAYGVACDFVEKIPLYDVDISPRFIQLVRDPRAGTIGGARIVGCLPKDDSKRYQQQSSEQHSRRFGILLFSLLYGEEAIGEPVDYENLPPRTSPEWQRIVDSIKKQIQPAVCKKTIDPDMEAAILRKRLLDTTIEYLLTETQFGVDKSIGILHDLWDWAKITATI